MDALIDNQSHRIKEVKEMIRNKKWILLTSSLVLTLLLLAIPFAGCSTSPAPAPGANATASPTASASAAPWGGIKEVRVADSAPGDPAMEIWALYASYWSQIPGIKSNAFGAATGTQIFTVSEGQAEVGQIFGSEIMQYRNVKNLPAGKTKAITNVLSIRTHSCLYGCFYVRADSKFQTLSDLKAANIGGSVSPAGFGGTALAMLEAAGVTMSNIGSTGGKISNMAVDSCTNGMKDRTLDAWLYGGTPAGASPGGIMLDQTTPLRIIHATPAELQKAIQLHPEFGINTLDWTGDIKSEKGSFQTLGDFLTNAVRADLPDDLVYQMCKQLFDTDCLVKVRAVGKSYWAQWLDNARIGYTIWGEHPGAKKYYDEKGLKARDSFLVKEK
jgi:uncharacterized protein